MKKRKEKKAFFPAGEEPDEKLISAGRFVAERKMAEIHRLLAQQDFKSLKEANAFLEKTINSGKPLPAVELSPLEQAQEIMYSAWESAGKKRIELAFKAIETSKDCADAYVLLGETMASEDELDAAKELFEHGVAAGERALGAAAFKKDAGHFWGILETRPYMRARLGLANCLWGLGQRGQAIAHYADMLRLNPDDNQGVRYILVTCLLEEGRDGEAGALLKKYNEGSADWTYSKTLWALRTEGEAKALIRLEEALKANSFVPAYLLGRKKMPAQLPEFISRGEEDEAVSYAASALEAWRKTPGALEWLAANQPALKPRGYWVFTGTPTKKEKTGRNDPCTCGSGKKYKKCCLRLEQTTA